jgi:hypothetical protein
LQNEVSGKVDSSTETVSSNLDKFKKSIIKSNTYFSSLSGEEIGEAINFFSDNCIIITGK